MLTVQFLLDDFIPVLFLKFKFVSYKCLKTFKRSDVGFVVQLQAFVVKLLKE